jgi:hypothetical protein
MSSAKSQFLIEGVRYVSYIYNANRRYPDTTKVIKILE